MTTGLDAPPDNDRVSTLELFFDLVFVFTITQLTNTLAHHLHWEGLTQVAIMLGILWWMYSGFAWLTNQVTPNSSIRRTLLFFGMVGFLMIALAIPAGFGESGWVFGVGYFVVNAVHTGLFLVSGGPDAVSGIKRIAPLNLLTAVLVLGGGLAEGWPHYVLWCAAIACQIATPHLVGQSGFDVHPVHFVERHGLIMIIALGETVVALGVGIAGTELTPAVIGAVALGLTLCYVLYWAYFGFDHERAEHAMNRFTGLVRAGKALTAFGYAHYPMLLGVVVMAAGIKLSIAHEGDKLAWPAAWALAAGAALFFAGHGAFRYLLELPRPWMRLLGGSAALGTVFIGVSWVAWAQLTILIIATYTLIIVDDLLAVKRWDITKR